MVNKITILECDKCDRVQICENCSEVFRVGKLLPCFKCSRLIYNWRSGNNLHSIKNQLVGPKRNRIITCDKCSENN